MADPTPAVQMPEWVLWVGGVIGTAMSLVIAKLGSVAGTKEKESTDKIGMIAALAPSPQFAPQRYTDDTLIQTLGELKQAIDRLNDTLEKQEEEKEADEKAELRELRQVMRRLDRVPDPYDRRSER